MVEWSSSSWERERWVSSLISQAERKLLNVFISSVTLRESGIDRPQKLDGKKYASYGARFEGRIVQQMIQQDGGKGDFEEIVPKKLGIWNTLLEKVADATWIFSGWEGCSASIAGIQLNEFQLSSYGYHGHYPLVNGKGRCIH